MAYATWPDVMPKPIADGFSRTPMEGRSKRAGEGPPGYKKRFSRMPVVYQMSFVVGLYQLQVFENFFNETVKGGSLPFWMREPVFDGQVAHDDEGGVLLDAEDNPVIVSAIHLWLFGDQLYQCVPRGVDYQISGTFVKMML